MSLVKWGCLKPVWPPGAKSPAGCWAGEQQMCPLSSGDGKVVPLSSWPDISFPRRGLGQMGPTTTLTGEGSYVTVGALKATVGH